MLEEEMRPAMYGSPRYAVCVFTHPAHSYTCKFTSYEMCSSLYAGQPGFPVTSAPVGYGYLVDLVCLFLFYFRQRGGGEE